MPAHVLVRNVADSTVETHKPNRRTFLNDCFRDVKDELRALRCLCPPSARAIDSPTSESATVSLRTDESYNDLDLISEGLEQEESDPNQAQRRLL